MSLIIVWLLNFKKAPKLCMQKHKHDGCHSSTKCLGWYHLMSPFIQNVGVHHHHHYQNQLKMPENPNKTLCRAPISHLPGLVLSAAQRCIWRWTTTPHLCLSRQTSKHVRQKKVCPMIPRSFFQCCFHNRPTGPTYFLGIYSWKSKHLRHAMCYALENHSVWGDTRLIGHLTIAVCPVFHPIMLTHNTQFQKWSSKSTTTRALTAFLLLIDHTSTNSGAWSCEASSSSSEW